MTVKELIDKIFKDPSVQYQLTEFESPAINFDLALTLITRPGTGKSTGKTIYYLKTLAPFHSDKEEVQIYVDDGKSNPEEILRQLWVYKLIHHYGYDKEEIALEKPVTFGTEIGTKFADIIVYTNKTKITPKIVLEIKKPKRKDGIDQLRSYLNAEGSPIGLWSNGSERVILYRPYPKDFDDTLLDLPRVDQKASDVIEAKRTLAHLKKEFNFKNIVFEMEELALANFGDGVFDEIFKLIFAKIYDEIEAESRLNNEVLFVKNNDPEITYENINKLFRKACEKWPGIFKETDKIELKPSQLSICIGQMVLVRLMGSDLRILDDAFEYLIPSALKKKDGQFFTPRHVIDMCVRMLNPKKDEFVMDPACGSAGFLLHTMDWVYPVSNNQEAELRKFKYASKYLWGIDFSEKASRTSRALMLIAGDGHTNIFGPRISTLDPNEWLEVRTGQKLIDSLRDNRLLKIMPPSDFKIDTKDDAWKYLDELQFDLVLSNPPFAGEVKGQDVLGHYQLARPALKRAKDKQAKEERDVLFIERIIKMLKPGGRAAIVLPQGKFNNSSLAFIREWILRKARLLAVVGLHGNTFKPHTGTKTSVLFIQKYTDKELGNIEKVQNEVKASGPDYGKQIEQILENHKNASDIIEELIPENIFELLNEEFSEPEKEVDEEGNNDKKANNEEQEPQIELSDRLEQAELKINTLKGELLRAKQQLVGLDDDKEALKAKQTSELAILTKNGNSKESIKLAKDEHKQQLKEQNEFQKTRSKLLKSSIKQLELEIPRADYEKNLITTRGKLQIILNDLDLLQRLSNRYIDAEVAKRLDYQIFMAVSELGGKNNSGEYEYMVNSEGNIIVDGTGNPVIKQDLVNFSITKTHLCDSTDVPFEYDKAAESGDYSIRPGIAEAFVIFAKEQGFNFWKE